MKVEDDMLKFLILVGVGVFALLMVLPILSSALGVKGPELPGIPGVVGHQVCDVTVTVGGIWNHYPIPGWMDDVKIDYVNYLVQNWRTIVYSMQPLGLSEGDGEMKIVWELYDMVGNPVQHGEKKFTGTSTWVESFQIYKVPPGGYKLKIEVWMNTKALWMNQWVLKDSRTVDVTVAAP